MNYWLILLAGWLPIAGVLIALHLYDSTEGKAEGIPAERAGREATRSATTAALSVKYILGKRVAVMPFRPFCQKGMTFASEKKRPTLLHPVTYPCDVDH